MAKIVNAKSRYLIANSIICAIAAIVVAELIVYEVYKFLIYNIKSGTTTISFFASVIVYGVLICISYVIFKRYDKTSLSYLYGLNGEDKVFSELQKLSDEYAIIQDVVSLNGLYGNIDFIVLGPTGVFAIESKSGRGKIEYIEGTLYKNNKKFSRSPIKQVKGNALAFHEYIKQKFDRDVYVIPAVVFSSYVDIKFGDKKIDDAFVVQKNWLNNVILDQSSELLDSELFNLIIEEFKNK